MICPGGLLKITRVKVKYVLFGILLLFILDALGVFTHMLETDYKEFTYPLEIDMSEVLYSIKEGRTPSHKPINEYNFRYKIKCGEKCKLENQHEFENVRLLYVIKSALSHQKRRDGIRKSWGWENRFSDVVIRRIFIVGSNPNDPSLQDQIDDEYYKHKDIVQADFIDTYYNNTIKTMMAMKWVVKNCPKAQFIMFVDDDFFVSTKNVLKFIRNPLNRQIGFRKLLSTDLFISHPTLFPRPDRINQSVYKTSEVSGTHLADFNKSDSTVHHLNDFDSKKNTSKNAILAKRSLHSEVLKDFNGNLFAGYVFFSSPMRHKSSKWYVSLEEYPFSKYPPYVTAGAFVLSFPALLDLYYTSLYTKHFRFDDIYLGIVAKKAGIIPLHNDNFHFWGKPYEKFSYSDVIASHGFNDPMMLQKIWQEQRSLGYA